MPQPSLPAGVSGHPFVSRATRRERRRLIEISGESETLVATLRPPLEAALSDKHRYYAVHVETVGRVGEVLVSISGSGGRLPLILGREDMEPGYVCRVVRDAVSRFGI